MEIFKIIESTVSGDMAIGGNGLAKKPMSFKNWLKKKKSKKKMKNDTEPKEPIEDEQEEDIRGNEE